MKFWMIVNVRQYSDDLSGMRHCFGYTLRDGTTKMFFEEDEVNTALFDAKKYTPDGDWILLESVGIVEENKGLMTIEDMGHYLG
jgi:hypothetical protein